MPEPDLQLKKGNHRTNQGSFGSPFFLPHRPTAWVELHRKARLGYSEVTYTVVNRVAVNPFDFAQGPPPMMPAP